MEIVRPVGRASTQDKPVKHPARVAARASTGLLQDKPLKHCARPAEGVKFINGVLADVVKTVSNPDYSL
jgi:hypothetical protein